MTPIAEDVFAIGGFPPWSINVYLVGDVLIDAGTRYAAGRILRQVRGRKVSAMALTHAHPDHQGSAHDVCEALQIPLWCGEADADAVERPELMIERLPRNWLTRTIGPRMAGPPHPVARRLREGDALGDTGFVAVESPGHCAGHVSFWRESDRVLVLGDVLAHSTPPTGLRGLIEPPSIFTPDPAENRRSARKLAALGPEVIAFGHGPPLRDARKLARLVARWDREQALEPAGGGG